MKARLMLVVLALALLLLITVAVVGGPMAAGSSEPLPSGSPSPTATPTPQPASLSQVLWARGWQNAAQNVRGRLCRVRECFGSPPPVRVSSAPKRSASGETWVKAGKHWRYQTRDWRAKVVAGLAKMRNPGGSGWERWRPLVRWIWPANTVNTVIQVMRYESGGNPRILNGGYILPNGAGDGQPVNRAGGLMQCLPAPRHWADPYYNLWYAFHKKFIPAGWSWSPWAGCAAF